MIFLINFIYLGQCQVDTNFLEEFLNIGTELGVTGMIQKEIKDNISNEDLHAKNDYIYDDIHKTTFDTHATEKMKEKNVTKNMNEKEYVDLSITHNYESVSSEKRVEKYQNFSVLTNKFQCPHCDKELYDRSTLKRHIKSKHEGVIYDCNHCEYKATQKSNLHRHMMTVHK